MKPLDRTLLVCLLLAGLAIVTAVPALAAAAVGLLVTAGLFTLIPGIVDASGERAMDAGRAVEGTEMEGRVRAEATLLAPTLVRLLDHVPDIAEPVSAPGFRVAWGTTSLEDRTVLEFPVPGTAEVGPLAVETVDPLGLTVSSTELARPEQIAVWPSVQDARANPLRARYQRILSGDHAVRNPGSSQEFYGIREYQPGDSQRDVNWKATIREQQLMVTQYQHETHGEFNIFLDNRVATAAGTLRNNPSHGVARAAATLASMATGHREILQAFTFGGSKPLSFRPEAGSGWMDQFRGWLAELEPTGNRDASVAFNEILPRLTPRSMVVFISPFVGAGNPLGDAPIQASALENSVLVVATPLPPDLPEPIGEQMRDQRAAAIQEARSQGLEILDMEREPSLVEALAVRGGRR